MGVSMGTMDGAISLTSSSATEGMGRFWVTSTAPIDVVQMELMAAEQALEREHPEKSSSMSVELEQLKSDMTSEMESTEITKLRLWTAMLGVGVPVHVKVLCAKAVAVIW